MSPGTRERRPGGGGASSSQMAKTLLPTADDPRDALAEHLNGAFVGALEVFGGGYRRRCFLTVKAAERAASSMLGEVVEMAISVYEAGHTKRSTKTEMAARYQALVEIVADAAPTGVRFCYYRAVSKGIVPKTNNGYVKVQRALMHLRESGIVPWEHITDSSRWMRKPHTWGDVEEMLADAAVGYRRALWRDADARVEVWCESESVAGVIWPVADEWDVPLFPIKGQTSAAFAHAAAMQYRSDDRPVIIYYVGDRDPAGLEIEANLAHKLRRYSARTDMFVQRLACTPEQVAELALIGHPPKKRTWRHPTLGRQPFTGQAYEWKPSTPRSCGSS